jgi:hypothetical protein
MRHLKTDKLNSSQKSVSHYPVGPGVNEARLRDQQRYFEALQSHMLIEDLTTQIIPIPGLSKREHFKIELVPASVTVESLVASALTSRRHSWRGELPSAVTDFIRECSQTVIAFDEATYEIVYFSDPANQGLVEFKFQYVAPLTVIRRGDQLIQVVPPSGSINLPADRILIFELPTTVRHSLARTLEALLVLSEKLVPDFALKNFAEAGSKFHYDSANHVYSRQLALAEAGKSIGWNARGLFNENMLEFYQLKRFLSFERFKIEFRASILATLNKGLLLAGKEMGFHAQINVQGVATISDVETANSELESGSKPFGEIIKPFLFY